MTLPPDHASRQSDFFSKVESDLDQQKIAEISTALYERELVLLANQGPNQIQQLRQRIAGLSHYVSRTARFLASNTVPLVLDAHNASWQTKQAAKSPARLCQAAKAADWFEQNAKVGLVVPVRIQEFDNEYIELDSIDRVNTQRAHLHLNKLGWFDFSGVSIDVQDNNARTKYRNLTLIKPNKSIVIAACCGHNWNHKGKGIPKTLSLREMLLVSGLNWNDFAKMRQI